MHFEHDQSTALIRLSGSLTIQFAEEIHQDLLLHLAEHADGDSMDLGAIEECDAAGVQLLLAFEKSLAKSGRKLRLVNPSDAFRKAAESIGVDLARFSDYHNREARGELITEEPARAS